ncbi:MAG: AAA family ATPase [Actinomycetota bacterium]
MSPTTTSSVAATLGQSRLLAVGKADVARIRAKTRRRRIVRFLVIFGLVDGYLWYRYLSGNPIGPPSLPADAVLWLPALLLIVLLGVLILLPMIGSGRSPHSLVRPEQIDVGLEELKGLDPQVDEVIRSLNVFLGHVTFRERLGGTPRRGILFEGPPGTGKTFLAKAMAKQAGVPFLFVSAPAFQSMWFGMTNAKIRAFFRALRKIARRQGGAIGFIEEIDAIGADRGAVTATASADDNRRSVSSFISPGAGGMVNELLIQMQSFDQPTWRQRLWTRIVEWINGYLPEGKRVESGRPEYHNILLIAATNRAEALDPALVRPGRFDRRLYFDLPTKKGRRDLIDYFLARKSHGEDLEGEEARERLAHDTFGYTPVALERLFDEALLTALRHGRDRMTPPDVYEAKLSEEVGLRQPVVYTQEEKVTVATHEAGHATVAHILGTTRRLEVLSIIKRRKSLGLLAHADLEERFTKSRSELEALVAIAMGGLAAEELFLGESGTGPGADLAAATEVAATMVGALGMAGSLVSYEAIGESAIQTRNLVAKVLADPDAKRRVELLLEKQRQKAVSVLEENRDIVESLRDALLDRDELVGNEIVGVIEEALGRRPVLVLD